ncbi:MAG: DUF2069 domain-containing protein [Moraxellaceae bacterium]|nr:DUF2069 domain-containing protein [Moraxellaceae bacterium]
MQYLRLSYVCFLAFLAVSTFALVALVSFKAALVLVIIKLVPLLLFLPAILQKKSYGLITLTLLVLVYMGFAVMDCFAGGSKQTFAFIGLGQQNTLLIVKIAELKQTFAFIELGFATWLILACSKAVKSLPRGHGSV